MAQANHTAPVFRTSDAFVIAAWAATIFGLLEGSVLVVCRAFPPILAAHKVSPHMIWIAPIIDLSLFLLAGAVVIPLLRPAQKWSGLSRSLIVYGFFVFIGTLIVISSPKLIHPASTIILSAGLAAVGGRKLASKDSLTCYLRKRMFLIPVLIIGVGLFTWGYEKALEGWRFRSLPSALSDAANVLVIVLDTVRYERLTLTSQNSLTPKLDRIAASGVTFENAWAPSSWSLPSQASVLTGSPPSEHEADWPEFRMNDEVPTLGEFFGGHGYVTGAFSGNAAWITPEYLGRGFLRFDVYILEDLIRRSALGRLTDRLLSAVGYHYAGRGKKAPAINAQFLKFLDDYPDRPFFAYICYMDVNQAFHNRKLNHGFWQEDPTKGEVVTAYEHGLTALDSQIDDLFARLRQRRVLDNTIVVITSDHGESFGADGTEDHNPPGHGTSLYPEQTRVPLFVVYPKTIPPGQRVDVNVSLSQIPATIARLLGSEDSPWSESPLPALGLPRSSHSNPPTISTLKYGNRKIASAVWDRWLYINDLGPQRNQEFYNLDEDPRAHRNLVFQEQSTSVMLELQRTLNSAE